MRKYIVLIITHFSLFSSAQTDFFEIIFDAEKPTEIKKDVHQIVERVYQLKLNENQKADTLFTHRNQTEQYVMEEKNIVRYETPYHSIATGFDNKGEKTATTVLKYFPNGLLQNEVVEYHIPYLKGQDRNKTFMYNREGKITSIINKLCDSCEVSNAMDVSYKNGMVHTVKMIRKDIGSILMELEMRDDTAVYRTTYSLTDAYKAKMRSTGADPDKLNGELLLVYPEEHLTVYKAVSVDYESGKPQTRWIKKRDKNHHLIEFKLFEDEKCIRHQILSFTDEGLIATYENVLSGATYSNKFTDSGQYLLKVDGSISTQYAYDEWGNITEMKTKSSGANYFTKVILREYTYK